MGQRRTRLEIYFDVLMAIKKGSKKGTHIMHAANISWQALNNILNSLISQGLIKEVNALHWQDKRIKKYYEFTPRGESMMRYLRDHTELLKNGELREFYG